MLTKRLLRHQMRAWILVCLLGLLVRVEAASTSSFKVIVHPTNKRQSIDRALLSKFFLRQAKLWETGLKVLPVNLFKDSKIRSEFSSSVHRQKVTSIEAFWLKQIFSGKSTPPPSLLSDKQIVAYVASNPGAIGYVSAGIRLDGVVTLEIETAAGLEELGSGAAGRQRDRQKIEALLRRYSLALENKDIEALKKVWPSLTSANSRAILESFKVVRTLRVSLFIQDFQTSGTSASVTCKRRDEMVPARGKPVVSDVVTTFVLKRADNGWVIDSIRN